MSRSPSRMTAANLLYLRTCKIALQALNRRSRPHRCRRVSHRHDARRSGHPEFGIGDERGQVAGDGRHRDRGRQQTHRHEGVPRRTRVQEHRWVGGEGFVPQPAHEGPVQPDVCAPVREDHPLVGLCVQGDHPGPERVLLHERDPGRHVCRDLTSHDIVVFRESSSHAQRVGGVSDHRR